MIIGRIHAFQLTSSVISFGAGLPGINAVVITMSTSRHCSKKSFISAAMNSFDISFAYPPAPEPSSSISTSTNSAPSDCTCSRAAGRVSKPRTMAPKRFAYECSQLFQMESKDQLTVAIALKPATPAPMTRTLHGGIYIAVRRGRTQVSELLTLL